MLEAARLKSGSTTTERGPRRASRSLPTLVWELPHEPTMVNGYAADSAVGERFPRVWLAVTIGSVDLHNLPVCSQKP